KSRIKQIDIDDYKKMPRGGHVLIDVREDNEWAAGHAAGAIHLGKGIIERDIETKVPDKSATMVCIAGADSGRRWSRMRFRRWATKTPSRSTAGGAPGTKPDFRSRSDGPGSDPDSAASDCGQRRGLLPDPRIRICRGRSPADRDGA